MTGYYPRLQAGADQSTDYHKQWYANQAQFVSAYRRFVYGWIIPLYGEPIIYQSVPTFRVHLPGNVAVGSWHRDSEFNHADYEDNFWLPFTYAWGSNSVWIEHGQTFRSVDICYGQLLKFNGATTIHGNTPNITGKSRVSVDFRAYPARLHTSRDAQTVISKRVLDIGDYWTHSNAL